MHPVPDEGCDTGEGFRLGNLRLVVGEGEFRAAAVQVVLHPEVTDCDRGVLDVPAGPARSPGTLPRRLPWLLGPPEDEVRRMPLALLDLDAGTRAELLHFLAAEFAPSGEGRRVEIDALVFRDVGVSLPDEALNLFHDLVDVVRRERVHVDRRALQPLHHVPEFREILRDDVVPGPPGRLHLRDDPVLDVRHVL